MGRPGTISVISNSGHRPPVSDQVPQRVWLRSTPMPVTEREWTPCAGSVCQRSPAWGRPRVTRSD